MIYLITTLTGSRYRVDDQARTWERLSVTGLSGRLRTDSGTWDSITLIAPGLPLVIIGPSVTGVGYRQITTSIMIEIMRESENGNAGNSDS